MKNELISIIIWGSRGLGEEPDWKCVDNCSKWVMVTDTWRFVFLFSLLRYVIWKSCDEKIWRRRQRKSNSCWFADSEEAPGPGMRERIGDAVLSPSGYRPPLWPHSCHPSSSPPKSVHAPTHLHGPHAQIFGPSNAIPGSASWVMPHILGHSQKGMGAPQSRALLWLLRLTNPNPCVW